MRRPLCTLALATSTLIGCGTGRPLFQSASSAHENSFDCAVEEAKSRGWALLDIDHYDEYSVMIAMRNRVDSPGSERIFVKMEPPEPPGTLTVTIRAQTFATATADKSVVSTKKSGASPQSVEDARAIVLLCGI